MQVSKITKTFGENVFLNLSTIKSSLRNLKYIIKPYEAAYFNQGLLIFALKQNVLIFYNARLTVFLDEEILLNCQLHVVPKVFNFLEKFIHFATVLLWKRLIIQELYFVIYKFSKKLVNHTSDHSWNSGLQYLLNNKLQISFCSITWFHFELDMTFYV